MTYLSEAQVEQLLRPINGGRVSVLDGLSHLQAYDVRAHLNRVFGFGRWSADVIDVHQLYEQATETKAKKPAFVVAYRATVRLTVNAPDGTVLATYTECATGSALMPDFKRGDAHDFALKTAESQAFKRCAVNLGDQFGLSLYDRGSRDAVVKGTLVGAETADAPEVPVVPALPDEVPAADPETGEIVRSSGRPDDAWTAPAPTPTPAPVRSETKADKAEKWMGWYAEQLDLADQPRTVVLLAKARDKRREDLLDAAQFGTLETLTKARQDALEVGAAV